MSEHKNLHEVDLLTYWQSQRWRAQFNQLNLTLDSLPHYALAPSKKNKIDCSQIDDNESIWLALMLQDGSDGHAVLLPIFIPAQVQQGRLVLRAEPTLPWIPGIYFSPDSQLYFKHVACYEDFLRYECINKQQAYCFSDFNEFQAGCLSLLDTLSNGNLQETVESLGLANKEKWLIFKTSDLMAESVVENNVLKNYGRFENNTPKMDINEDNYFDYAHLVHAQVDALQALSPTELQSVLSILSLKKGGLQAITAPIGTDTHKIIQKILANQFTAQALGNKPPPTIGVFSRNPKQTYFDNTLFLDQDIFISYCQKILSKPELTDIEQIVQVIHQKMMFAYEDNLNAINLMRIYAKAQKKNIEHYHDVSIFLSNLAEEDDKTDSDRHKYLEIHAQWQALQKSQGILQKCFSLMPFVKSFRQKKAGQYLEKALENEPVKVPYEQQLIEYIRGLKVKQAKNDQKRIKAVDFSNRLQSAKTNWQKWAAAHGEKQAAEDIDMVGLFELLAPTQQEVWQLCSLYWQALNLQSTLTPSSNISCMTPWSLQILSPFDKNSKLSELSDEQEMDYLFIEEAHLLSPVEILPVLSKAKRVVFFGDNIASMGRCLLPKFEDEYLFKIKQNISEPDLEFLQASGHLLSSANAFQVAQNNSEFQSLSPCGLYRTSYLALNTIQNKNKDLFQYWNEHYHHNSLSLSQPIESHGPSINFVPVLGNMHLGLNVAEIEKIVSFIQNDLNNSREVAVITPFYHQKQLLARLLELENITVHTFEDLPTEPKDFIIFSPVYTAKIPRPHIYDEGDAYFYRLLGLAKQALWIFGDPAILNAKTHSPSGKIAKFLKDYDFKEVKTEVV
tara:strand:- start:39598 stop:42129 length:2532 start_codon:yes stop_codon:yes gene_type:complete